MNLFTKTTLATALAASALATTSPAMARDHYRRNDNPGTAIAVGVVGLALGAIIASAANDRNRRDRGEWRDRDNGYYRDGYAYDRDGYANDPRDPYYRGEYRDNRYYRGY